MRNSTRWPHAGLTSPLPMLPLILVLVATSTVAAFAPNDVIVSDPTSDLPDPEFDVIDNHMVWQTTTGDLWLARIDPESGDFHPADGKGQLLDTNLRGIGATGNGVEWASGDGKPYLAYTRNFLGGFLLGGARQDRQFGWHAMVLGDSVDRWRPEGTAPDYAGPPRIAYNYTLPDGTDAVAWRELFTPSSEDYVTQEGLQAQGGRWIGGEDRLLVSLRERTFEYGSVDTAASAPAVDQITFTDGNKINPFSWIAPEYDEPVFSGMLLKGDRHLLGIYRRANADPNSWELFNSIALPTAPEYPYLSSPEGFTHNGRSYVAVVAASALGGDSFKFQPKGPSQIWITGIDPADPFFRRVDDPSEPFATQPQRSEPEVYVTAAGPVIYYTELIEKPGENIRLVRRADTGLGPEWGHDLQSYGGPWATVNGDSRNSGSRPFPLADDYVEASAEQLPNRQSIRATMGPEGRLYFPMFRTDGPATTAEFRAIDTNDNNRESFTLSDADISAGFVGTGSLIDPAGNFFLAGEERLNKFNPQGERLWTSAVPGLPRALQYTADGRIVFFSWNGWFQSVDPQTGAAQRLNLTPNRTYGETSATCFTGGDIGQCAYIDAPAVDTRAARIYATYTSRNGDGRVQSFDYDDSTGLVSLAWTTETIQGNVTSPVLSADRSRLYVQNSTGELRAIDATNGATLWITELGFTTTTPKEPVVNDFGYIMPGGDASDAAGLDYISILKDQGDAASWQLRARLYAPLSQAAAGRGNRFVLAARRLSDGAAVLLVVSPFHGVISETPWTGATPPTGFTGITVREDGWVFLNGGGSRTFTAYQPIWPQSN